LLANQESNGEEETNPERMIKRKGRKKVTLGTFSELKKEEVKI